MDSQPAAGPNLEPADHFVQFNHPINEWCEHAVPVTAANARRDSAQALADQREQVTPSPRTHAPTHGRINTHKHMRAQICTYVYR